jgi:hypothetical protein
MSIEEELRQMLSQVGELPAPNLRPGVMSAITPRRWTGLSAWPRRVAAFGLAVVLVIGVAWVSLSTFEVRPAGPPNGQSSASSVASSTGDQPSASIGPPSPTSGVPSPSSTDAAGLALATNPPDGGGSDALAVGRLGGTVVDDRACFWIEPTASGGVDVVRTALIWPHGFRAVDDPLRLLTPDRQSVARIGDLVELGGGGPPVAYVPTSQQDPCQIGRIFSVSVVVSVNGARVDVSSGSLQITTRPLGDTGTCGATFLDPLMLVMTDEHLQLRMNVVDWEASWPYGFKAVGGERITIVDNNGVVVLRQGDETPTVRGSIVSDQIEVCGFGEVTYR